MSDSTNRNRIYSTYYRIDKSELCEEWKESKSFLTWALEQGYEKGMRLSRKDDSLPYSPDNCYWITRQEIYNKRDANHFITIDGERKTIAEWSRIAGVDRSDFIHKLCTKGVDAFSKDRIVKKINQYDLSGNYLKTWNSLYEIEQKLGYSSYSISKCCNGTTKTSHGFIWRFKGENNEESIAEDTVLDSISNVADNNAIPVSFFGVDYMSMGDALMVVKNITLPISDKRKLKAIEMVLDSQEQCSASYCYHLRSTELYKVVRYLFNFVKGRE